jgi:hypothetical protein
MAAPLCRRWHVREVGDLYFQSLITYAYTHAVVSLKSLGFEQRVQKVRRHQGTTKQNGGGWLGNKVRRGLFPPSHFPARTRPFSSINALSRPLTHSPQLAFGLAPSSPQVLVAGSVGCAYPLGRTATKCPEEGTCGHAMTT